MILQKTEVNGIYREETSGALINQDIDALSAYKKRKKIQNNINSLMEITKLNQQNIKNLEFVYNQTLPCINKSNEEISKMKTEIDSMRSDLFEIKALLLQITTRQ
jgi:hypothetical protein